MQIVLAIGLSMMFVFAGCIQNSAEPEQPDGTQAHIPDAPALSFDGCQAFLVAQNPANPGGTQIEGWGEKVRADRQITYIDAYACDSISAGNKSFSNSISVRFTRLIQLAPENCQLASLSTPLVLQRWLVDDENLASNLRQLNIPAEYAEIEESFSIDHPGHLAWILPEGKSIISPTQIPGTPRETGHDDEIFWVASGRLHHLTQNVVGSTFTPDDVPEIGTVVGPEEIVGPTEQFPYQMDYRINATIGTTMRSYGGQACE